MRTIELLAPAKDLECGKAAVDHGADAVYIGPRRFGARAAAANSLDDIEALCHYAHPFGVRVYATVNTLLFDSELTEVKNLVCGLKKIGVDALIAQDMALVNTAAAIPLHASTQTDNRSAEKVRWLRDIGFSRVILARELSIDDIRRIHHAVPDIELEVFVHGALCVSYSGRCYASQRLFGRSANRGECAQVCRMKFSLDDADGHRIIQDRYLLSLKDMCRIDNIEELLSAGVTSLKIEGRLKDAGYVKNVVSAYSRRLNAVIAAHPGVYRRASTGRCTYSFSPDVNKTFNRGFTDYFLHGRQRIGSFSTPKARGPVVGTVKAVIGRRVIVEGTSSFVNGDGLCFYESGKELQGFRVNKVDSTGSLILREIPKGLSAGTKLWRNNDAAFKKLLRGRSAHRFIPITLTLKTTEGGFTLTADNVSAEVAAPHQRALTPQRDNIISQLSRTGGTRYFVEQVNIDVDFPWFLPNSVLAALRSNLLSLLERENPTDNGAEIGESISHPFTAGDMSLKVPSPDYYRFNIANRMSSHFFGDQPVNAFELKAPRTEVALMTCRHCLRYELGHCVKYGGKNWIWREPLSLVLTSGRRLRLNFNCKTCQMEVMG